MMRDYGVEDFKFNPALLITLSEFCEGFGIRFHSAGSFHKTPSYWSGWAEQHDPYYAHIEMTAPSLETLAEALFDEVDFGFPSTDENTGYGYREVG